ncbi:MAG: DNA cytosine methyltransferase, partial [Candidatus Hodarchaeales archaeon]
MKFIDTFAGVGGFHLGVKNVLPDAECVLAVEWDKDAQYSYHENFPETPIFGDITELKEEDIPEHDLLTGGFPCQPFSINKQSSVKKVYDEEDNRSNLFLQLVRIADLKKPKYLLFENVAALASMKNKDGGLVIEEIKYAFEQIGYNVDY